MKTVQVQLNDRLASELDALMRAGFFNSEEEAIRFALLKYIQNHEPLLSERFQLEDIAWARKQKRQEQ